MAWLQLRLQTDAETAEALSAYLHLLDAAAVTLQDAADQPLFEPALNTTPLWAATWVIALFTENTDPDKIVAFIHKQFSSSNIIYYPVELLEDQVWERAWLEHFRPMCFGQRLWICPSTSTPPDPGAVNIILDPGLAFGTGTHATTALCLTWLDANAHLIKNKTIVDYGCGSGILAIAALKLGAAAVWAVDHDPQALEATRDNAQRNQLDLNKLHVVSSTEFLSISQHEPFLTVTQREQFLAVTQQLPALDVVDIVIANILAQPLLELAPLFAKLLSLHGIVVLSGILEQQVAAITTTYQQWFTINDDDVAIRDEWVRVVGKRH